MKQIPEHRNLLTMWGVGQNETPRVTEPDVTLNYFTAPGLIKEPPVPTPYHREPGNMVQPQFDAEFICRFALRQLRLTHQDLTGACRKQAMVDARCIIVGLCYKYSYKASMRKISDLINRDRTTAIHMVQRANNCIDTCECKFVEKLQRIEGLLLSK